jgi:hypothetical protein
MSLGAGKYDPAAMRALKDTRGEAVILIVVGGFEGHGFSTAIQAASNLDAANRIDALCDVMQSSVTSMRADAKRLRNAAVGEKS